MEDNEPPEALNEDDEEEAIQENAGGDEMNNIQLLLEKETENPQLNDQQTARIINDIWLQEARTRALRYIARTGKELHIRVETLYISVVYLDTYLATRTTSVGVYWRVILLAVTCMSLSAQMEVKENRRNVPLLSEYPLGNWDLSVHDIRRMEVMVQNVFLWNMTFVTPFPFARFFLSRYNRQISAATRKRTTRIILTVFRDVRLMNTHRSSVIAVAAILLAVNNNLTREELETEINVLPLNGFLNIDNVWYCYNRLR